MGKDSLHRFTFKVMRYQSMLSPSCLISAFTKLIITARVCPSFSPGVLCDHYPWCIESHCTAPPHPMRPHCRGARWPQPSPRHETSLYRNPLLVIPGVQHWRPVQTCSLQYTPTHRCWHLVAFEAGMVSASWQYTSYWNAFLLHITIIVYQMEFDKTRWSCSQKWILKRLWSASVSASVSTHIYIYL